MQAFVKTLNSSYAHAETAIGRVFVQADDCDFLIGDLEVGDEIDIERVIDTARGLRADGAVRWLSRPRDNADEIDGTVVTVKPQRGFCFARPDDGGKNVFLNIRDFTDYREGGSATYRRLAPGDRVTFSRVAGHPGPQGFHVRAAA
jgi:cold shock CspA family protein